MLRIGWFSTGQGLGSRNLLEAVMDEKEHGMLKIDIAFVFCNWDNDETENPKRYNRQIFFDMIKRYNIPLITISWKKFKPDLWINDRKKWRDEYGSLIRQAIKRYNFDLIILAGYMLWIDEVTCRDYNIINLHPSLPNGPKGTWQEVIWQLIHDGADKQGAMIHVCTDDWDNGEPLTYCEFPLRGGEYDRLWDQMKMKLKSKTLESIKLDEGQNEPLFKSIRDDGTKREIPLMILTIKKFADSTITIKNNKFYSNKKLIKKPDNLSKQIDALLK